MSIPSHSLLLKRIPASTPLNTFIHSHNISAHKMHSNREKETKEMLSEGKNHNITEHNTTLVTFILLLFK